MCTTLLAGHSTLTASMLTKHRHHAPLPIWNTQRALSCLRRGSALRFIPKAPKTFVLFVCVWFLSVSKMKSWWFMFFLSFFISMAVYTQGSGCQECVGHGKQRYEDCRLWPGQRRPQHRLLQKDHKCEFHFIRRHFSFPKNTFLVDFHLAVHSFVDIYRCM